MGVLGDGGRGSLASADGPHGLVSNDDVGPLIDGGLDGIELSLKHVVGLVCLSLLEGLTNTKDSLEAGCLSAGHLLGNDIVGLTEELSALGVANKGPLEAEVNDLLGTDLASECTVALGADVLGSNENIGVKHRLGGSDVEGDGSDDDLEAVRIEFHSVKGLGAQSAHEVDRAIALPVSSDDVFSLGGGVNHCVCLREVM